MTQTEIRNSINTASEAFVSKVWPVIRPHLGGGEIIPVETVTDVDFAKQLDMLAGIDAWHVLTINGVKSMRGIACRVQWDSGHPAYPFKTFTIRCDIGGGQTEYHKRKAAIEAHDRGALYPHLTVQAYLSERSESELLQYGIIETSMLIQYCNDTKIESRKPLTNPKDGHKFWPVPWDATIPYGCRYHVT
jgi:hypothetical protein